MELWYRWDDLETAQACLDYLNNRPEFPLIGENAKTGKKEPNKTKTIKWVENVIVCTDGKYRFPMISEKLLNYLNISLEEQNQFLETFQPIKEEFKPTWLPDPIQ